MTITQLIIQIIVIGNNISATGDLCKFSIKEFEGLLSYLGTTKHRSLTTIEADMSRMYNYLSYCQPLPGASLTKENIVNYYKRDFHSVKDWLNALGVHTDYSNITMSIHEMLKIHNSNKFDEQEQGLYWLLFLGLRPEEIVTIEMNQTDNWQGLLKGNIKLNADIKETVSIALNRARSQEYIEKDGANGGLTKPSLKGNKYFFRSDKGKGNSPISVYFARRYVKISEYLDKDRLGYRDIYKSGMIYFTSELLNSNNINSKDDYVSKIFQLVCKMYGENPETYWKPFNDMMLSNILLDYYNIQVPESARERRVVVNGIISPEQWKETDKKTYRDHEDLGAKGELLLRERLKLRYSTCYKTKDYSGFDIFVKNNNNDLRCIEVKTMTNRSCPINITENEYRVAHGPRYGDYYWFYLIVMDTKPIVYVYKNFFGLLGMNDIANKIFQENRINSLGSYFYKDFSIKLSEDMFSKSDEFFEL